MTNKEKVMDRILESLEKYILYATVLVLPLAVLPIFPNPFGLVKLTILAFGVSLVFLVKAIRILTTGSLKLSVGNFDFPLFLLAAAYIVSAIIKTPNKMEAFFFPGNATLILASFFLYFLINQLSQDTKEKLGTVLFASGIGVSLISLLAASRVLSNIPQLPNLIKNSSFATLGGPLPTAIFLVSLLPLGIGKILSEKESVKKLFFSVCTAILLLGMGVSVVNTLPGKPTSPRLLDFRTSWSVSIDTLKESPLLGIGAGNYLTAFNRFRPLGYNQTDLWATRFTSARSFYLTVFTETGLIGAAGIVLAVLTAVRLAKKTFRENRLAGWGIITSSAHTVSLLVLLTSLVFFSATPSLVVLFFILFALNNKVKTFEFKLWLQTETGTDTRSFAVRLPAILLATPVIVAVIAFFFFSSKALAAEAKFKKALDALAQNDGKATYDLMREAISINPYVDRYHASYAQVNLALANSIAQRKGEEITEEDRATIAQLIQQAIREGKATVALNPQRAGNWEILARIYQSIMPFAQGSDQFAIQTFSQAVVLDPFNPNLRIALGGVYYAIGDYDNAIDTFKLAVLAKPDHANAHYNLAVAYREKGEIDKAINEMSIVLSQVDRNSQDYELAKRELENLENRKPATEATKGTSNLTPPQPAEKPALEPPLELPEEASPPEAPEEVTPSPTPRP